MPKRKLRSHQRRHSLESEIVKLRAILAADLNGVLETGRSDESNARTFTLEQRVSADGRAVQKNDASRRSDLRKRRQDCLGRIGGSGEDFDHAQLPALQPDAVGKGTAGIDGNPERRLRSFGTGRGHSRVRVRCRKRRF